MTVDEGLCFVSTISFPFFLIVFYLFTPFFFLAKEKGPKRTAPLGAEPVFP